MRIYHPKTLQILASRKDIPKRYSCSVWSECFKWKASGKPHPKQFIDDDEALGSYLALVFKLATLKGCDLDDNKIRKLGSSVLCGWNADFAYGREEYWRYFDDNYLFSDACSLYFKGINIFEDLFPESPAKYIPVISHKEIIRQCNKTLNNV